MKHLKLILLLLSSPIIVYVSVFRGGISADHTIWSSFGSYLSGIYGSLSFFGVLYSIYLTESNIIKQDEDKIFYKLLETLQAKADRDLPSSEEGRNFLYTIIQEYVSLIGTQCFNLGWNLLSCSPQDISQEDYERLVFAINKSEHSDIKSQVFYNNLVNTTDRNEFLKHYIEESEKNHIWKEVKNIGVLNFYKIPLIATNNTAACCRTLVYEKVAGIFLDNYPSHNDFLEKYIHSFTLIIFFCLNAKGKKLYIEILKSQLTSNELVVIFYYLTTKKADNKLVSALKEYKLLDNISFVRTELLFNAHYPGHSSRKKELDLIIDSYISKP